MTGLLFAIPSNRFLPRSLHYEHDERTGFHFSLRPRTHVCGYREESMGPAIDCHGACAFLCRHHLHHAELIAAVFLDHRNRSVSCRGKSQPTSVVERGGIATISYGRSCQDLSAIGIDNRHLLVSAATHKQAAVFPVDGQTSRLFTLCELPA